MLENITNTNVDMEREAMVRGCSLNERIAVNFYIFLKIYLLFNYFYNFCDTCKKLLMPVGTIIN